MFRNCTSIQIVRTLSVAFLLMLFTAQYGFSGNSKEGPGNPRAGRSLFVDKGCMRCHSIWGSADKKAPALVSLGMGRNLYEVSAALWSHWPQMKASMDSGKQASAVVSSSEFRDIIAYLYSLNYYNETGDESAGARLFVNRGCFQCHSTDPVSTEQKSAPPIYNMAGFESPINLAVALWNHGGAMLQRMSQKKMQWPKFQGKEVADLVGYIRSKSASAQELQLRVPGDPERGREIYQSRSCAECHEAGPGGSRVGPNLESPGTAMSLSSLVADLWNHYPKMAETIARRRITVKEMTTTDMEDLIAYVYWIRSHGLDGNAVAGAELYKAKQCATCHARNGKSGAPSLSGSETTRSPYSMLAAIWNHGPKMQALLQEKQIAWPALTGPEMKDLIAYFRRQQNPRE